MAAMAATADHQHPSMAAKAVHHRMSTRVCRLSWRSALLLLLIVWPYDASGLSCTVHMGSGKRAVGRARGKARTALQRNGHNPSKVETTYEIEFTAQNVAEINFSNGTRMEVYTPDLEQTQRGTWLAVRAALEITASEFAAARNAWRHATREGLLERKLGVPRAQFRGNAATNFGLETEPRAVEEYARVTGNVVRPTGLHMHPNLRWGASPDGIVTTPDGDTGLLEVKCFFRLRNTGQVPQVDVCPPAYYDQIQGQLVITDLQWCDLMMYVPARRFTPGRNWCIVRVNRDDEYFRTELEPHLESFGEELARLRAADAAERAQAEAARVGEGITHVQSEYRGGGEGRAAAVGRVGGDASASVVGTALRSRARHRARASSHDALVSLVAAALRDGPRRVAHDKIVTETALGSLPDAFGLDSVRNPLLTPDVVALDGRELLVAEVTIVPDAALGRYVARKRRKYAPLRAQHAAQHDGGADDAIGDMTMHPPAIIAVGTSGELHPDSVEALATVFKLNVSQIARFSLEAAQLAQARPGFKSRHKR